MINVIIEKSRDILKLIKTTGEILRTPTVPVFRGEKGEARLARFFDLLITPLKDFACKYRRLIIAPHLFWHYLPFQAIYNKKEKAFLCDQVEIAYSPSASVLDLCQQKNRVGRDCALILSRNNGDLPHVDQEADLVSRAFSPDSHVFKGKQAYLGQIRNKNINPDVIHLACHGQFNQEAPFLSGIEIPPEAEDDRWTYLSDLFSLRLDCSLATLSACESGLSRFTSADELTGLSRGLFMPELRLLC